MKDKDMNLKQLPKRLSFSHKEAFEKCPRQYELRALGAARMRRLPPSLIGKALEEIAAHDSSEKSIERVKTQLERRLSDLPIEERQEHLTSLEQLVESHQEMQRQDKSATNTCRNKLYVWKDHVTGWELLAKPDEISTTLDAYGKRVVEIADDKTSERLTRKHKRQLYFFGLVVHMIREDSEQLGKFRDLKAIIEKVTSPCMVLVVRLLGSETRVPFWFARARVAEKLAEVRRVCRQIEKSFLDHNFPTRPDRQTCNQCPFNQSCLASQADGILPVKQKTATEMPQELTA